MFKRGCPETLGGRADVFPVPASSPYSIAVPGIRAGVQSNQGIQVILQDMGGPCGFWSAHKPKRKMEVQNWVWVEKLGPTKRKGRTRLIIEWDVES